ncbi:hypothetical protein HG536_0D00880 [Torulaspora globosa]|uniref:Pre-rRNA-processing protein IPI3 n=1 Tax=Torulaspora globosa TaxID=48254 RepID=A0A7G3ZGD0_9SACH|nr:uncharacterized protein HG536_0D00880 [Torulaspora globosa]QLL32566.1 hypothetical protein HG536_0D00880 [Torulaspora globosa]
MDEQVIFTTDGTGSISSIHSFEQSSLRQCSTSSKNSAVRVGDKFLFVAQAHKALINVYNVSGPHKRESVEQRLPLPEVVRCLEVVENRSGAAARNDSANHKLPEFNLPYLLLASTESGKLYVWELNSGILLSVKPMAHYQAITKIRSILDGKYIVTSGADARVIIWQTTDLVSVDEPKPVCILHDHTLPVTDFQVSSTYGEFLSLSGAKLFTVSEDATLRCYDLSSLSNRGSSKNSLPNLVATFTFPLAIAALALDPADRACYIGTDSGCFSLQLFYKLSGSKIVNLTQSSDSNASGARIYSLVEASQESSAMQHREKLYLAGQLVCEKLIDAGVSCLKTSMDGTLLLAGDCLGKVSVIEIFSKQILRAMQPVTSSQETQQRVTNILLEAQSATSKNGIITEMNARQSSKIPSLQRVIHDRATLGQLHEINFQVGEDEESIPLPVSDFESYADQLRSQQAVLSRPNGFNSSIKTFGSDGPTGKLVIGDEDDDKERQIADLKDNVETLKQAYQELRGLHEKLYQEHEKLLQTSN